MILLLIIIATIFVILFLIVANKPATFRIERRDIIGASAEVVYAQLQDFSHWKAWSPWEKMDPNLQRHYSGAHSGVGAAYAWRGNKKVGEGLMEILEAEPNQRLLIRLDFFKPFEAHNTAEFLLQPMGEQTRIAWIMEGPNTIPSKIMSLFINIDKMVGKDFEAGLANLKKICQTSQLS